MDQLFTISDSIFIIIVIIIIFIIIIIVPDWTQLKEVLRQVKAKAESLGFESTNLVFDHAIYAKAVEILTNPANKQVSLISEWVRFMLAVYTWQNLVKGLVLQE